MEYLRKVIIMKRSTRRILFIVIPIIIVILGNAPTIFTMINGGHVLLAPASILLAPVAVFFATLLGGMLFGILVRWLNCLGTWLLDRIEQHPRLMFQIEEEEKRRQLERAF